MRSRRGGTSVHRREKTWREILPDVLHRGEKRRKKIRKRKERKKRKNKVTKEKGKKRKEKKTFICMECHHISLEHHLVK